MIKIQSFLQGGDNQVVIKSAYYFGINKVVMPFASANVVLHTALHNSKDILQPKRVVKDANIKMENINLTQRLNNNFSIKPIIFSKYLKSLL